MDDLRKTYAAQMKEYDDLIATALANRDASMLPSIRDKATQIQATLNKMVETLTYLKKETPDLRTEREALLERLRRVQRDYNVLVSNTDDLETLRRIRQEEGSDAKRQLYQYLAFFFLLAVVMILYVLFMSGRQKKDSTPSSAATPAMSPPLT